MKRKVVVLVASVLPTLVAETASAHHSLSEFLGSAMSTLEGIVTEYRFVNPHAILTLDVADDDGGSQEWTLVMDDRWELVEAGFSRHTFQPGDRLVVRGRAGRVNPQSMYISHIERPSDGFVYTEEEGEFPDGVAIGDLIANTLDERDDDGPPHFDELDSNDDGSLSADELAALYERLVLLDLIENFAPTEQALLRVLDADESGGVSEEEYASRLSL